ncbi:MAG: hypothetical protein JO010_09870 [Alphaproteobacteria bacterium]|nr:hypothetical protein [Alphaproteobacteria bacterium]
MAADEPRHPHDVGRGIALSPGEERELDALLENLAGLSADVQSDPPGAAAPIGLPGAAASPGGAGGRSRWGGSRGVIRALNLALIFFCLALCAELAQGAVLRAAKPGWESGGAARPAVLLLPRPR